MGDENTNKLEFDMDKDGKITEFDVEISKLKYEEERIARRQFHQRQMAWVSLVAMLVFTMFLFLPVVPDTRIKLLSDISNLFYLAQAGIVGAFMGAAAIMNNKK